MPSDTSKNCVSSLPFILSIFGYGVVVSILVLAVLLIISNPPEISIPPTTEYKQGAIVLENFSIPYYTKEGEQFLLVSGKRAIMEAENFFKIIAPEVSYFSQKEQGRERISFTAESGNFDKKAGIALLTGKVKVQGILEKDGEDISTWNLAGDSVEIDQNTGAFKINGLVRFESPDAKLFGNNLSGKLDPQTTELQYIRFESRTRSLFKPR